MLWKYVIFFVFLFFFIFLLSCETLLKGAQLGKILDFLYLWLTINEIQYFLQNNFDGNMGFKFPQIWILVPDGNNLRWNRNTL